MEGAAESFMMPDLRRERRRRRKFIGLMDGGGGGGGLWRCLSWPWGGEPGISAQ